MDAKTRPERSYLFFLIIVYPYGFDQIRNTPHCQKVTLKDQKAFV